LYAAIRQLSIPDQQIVMLYLEGLSATEMSEVLGISPANVATRLTRIRKMLRWEATNV
jgi:RNA polymerase sigma-70 factor (ECF subfamily)